jgi:hypothetical protein
MKNINSSSKTETRLGQAVRPVPAFISGIIAGSILTVYGTLTHVNLFNYIGSNSRDIIGFYRDLLGLPHPVVSNNQELKGYFEKLNIRVDPVDLRINALPSSICAQMIREGDKIRGNTPSAVSQKSFDFDEIAGKIKTIIDKGTGTLEIQSIQDETVLIEIDLLSKKQNCRRKTPKIQQLEKLLQEKKWQSADEKTYEVLLDIANRQAEGNLDRSSIQSLNCSDLTTVNQLWSENSASRFGFKVQQEIYTEIGNNLEADFLKKYDPNLYIQFSDLVRWIQTQEDSQETWKSNNQLIYSLDAPKGHLPRINRLEDGMEQEPGYQLISPNSLKLTSQEIEARNLFYARIKACEL